jgi:hypothetical protein
MTLLATEDAGIRVERLFKRLYEMGLMSLPLPNSTGSDDGLLFHRDFAEHIDTVAVWAENYAVALRVPKQRNWAAPFAPSPVIFRRVGTLDQAVSGLAALPPYCGSSGAKHRQD